MDQKRLKAIYVLLAILVGLVVIRALMTAAPIAEPMAYSELRAAIVAGKVTEVVIAPRWIRAQAAGVEHQVVRVEDPDLYRELAAHHVKITGEVEATSWQTALAWVLPLVLIFALWRLASSSRLGGRSADVLAAGHSKAKPFVEKEIKARFQDVAGLDEAKEELGEVIEFLRTPERFRRLGAHIPKGVLLVGPPGTGKTLLARAVAGEARVPFFSISASEFVEMFVGVGAARVRDLFQQAQAKAPCIIFIDELDALGKARGMGPMAHEEREQTLNQLLVEMDGFDPRVGVILMAATNRPEILDPALLRAGRFDRHVLVDRPDRKGRIEILKVHARKVPLANAGDLNVVAGMTAGFAGADLANIVNEAALLAARLGRDHIELRHLQEAVERVVAGLEKRNRVLTLPERRRVAYHEVGHALVALSVAGSDQVQKVSIIPRGVAALGYTLQLPSEDRFLRTQAELEGKIAALLGGRAAETITFGDLSTGGEDDLRKATDIARAMVRSYGMSPRLGAVSFSEGKRAPFLGQAEIGNRDHGEGTAHAIDAEVKRILDEAGQRAAAVLAGKREALRRAAEELLARETLSGDELREILDGEICAEERTPGTDCADHAGTAADARSA
jgi:cell division protease FtsH